MFKRGGPSQFQFQRKNKSKSFNIFTFSIPMGEDLPFPLPSNTLSHSHLACDYDLESFIFPPLFLSFFSSFPIRLYCQYLPESVLDHDQKLTSDASPYHSFQKIKLPNSLFLCFFSTKKKKISIPTH
jgi:hypothetical protein